MTKTRKLLLFMGILIGLFVCFNITTFNTYATELSGEVIINDDGSTAINSISATVTGSTVNVRADASTAAQKAGSVTKDMVVTIDARKEDASGDMWYRIFSSANGTEVSGFVRYDFLSISGEVVVKTQEEPTETQTPEDSKNPEPTAEYEVSFSNDSWHLKAAATGDSYVISDLIEQSKNNSTELVEMQSQLKQQKTSNMILIIILVIVALILVGMLINFREELLTQLFDAPPKTNKKTGGKQPSNGKTRPDGRPTPNGRPRPDGRPAPNGRPRPDGRPAPNGRPRPDGRPAPDGRPRPDGKPVPNGRPVPSERATTTKLPVEQADIKKQTTGQIKEQEYSNNIKEKDPKWNAKNFIENDDFDYEFIDLSKKD